MIRVKAQKGFARRLFRPQWNEDKPLPSKEDLLRGIPPHLVPLAEAMIDIRLQVLEQERIRRREPSMIDVLRRIPKRGD